MSTLSLVKGSLGIVLASVLMSCGGAETPPAKEPESEPTEAAQAKESKAEEPKEEASEESKEAPKSEASKSGRKAPKDVIGDPDLAFMYSFKDSDLSSKKEEECSKKAKDDVEKKAACLSKAAEAESHDIRFVKDDQGEDWYIVFRRQGDKAIELSRIKYSIGKEGSNQITLNLTGRDMGKKPMAKVPSELVIEIVDDYSIALNDPVKGKVVYRGKSGLFSDSSTKERR
jgi:hypothetical protein